MRLKYRFVYRVKFYETDKVTEERPRIQIKVQNRVLGYID